MKKVTDDIKNRGRLVSAIVEDDSGMLQLIGYDSQGLVSFISGKVECLLVNERLTGNMVRSVVEIKRRNKT